MSDQSEDFAAMFEASVQAKRLEQGELVEGRIVAIGPEVALVDVGRKGEAVIDIAELKNADGEFEVAVGDLIQAMVVSTSGGLTLSRKLAGAAASDQQFEAAFESGLPVEGKVERQVKGGYELRIGRRRAFCPISQIDLRGAEASAHEGHVYQFRIIAYKEGGSNLVVSRRVLLEDEQRANAAKLRGKIVPGAVLTGRVTSVREFGAFVELEPGVEALAHASTFMPTGGSKGWAGQVAPGMTGTFEILTIDPEQKRIGVALVEEAWARAEGATGARPGIVPGARLTGKVERHEEFGVFVFLAPGRTGVIPLGETGIAKEGDIQRAFPVGADVEVIVLEVDPSGRRIRLSAKAVMEAREAEEVREWTERNAPPAEGSGILADKLRSALKSQEK